MDKLLQFGAVCAKMKNLGCGISWRYYTTLNKNSVFASFSPDFYANGGYFFTATISTCLRNTRSGFPLFLGNLWWESVELSALATLYSVLTEIRQVKPDRFQLRSLEKFSSCSFLHSGNSTNTTQSHVFFISLFSGGPSVFTSNVARCLNFFQGNGVFNKNFCLNIAQDFGVLHPALCI